MKLFSNLPPPVAEVIQNTDPASIICTPVYDLPNRVDRGKNSSSLKSHISFLVLLGVIPLVILSESRNDEKDPFSWLTEEETKHYYAKNVVLLGDAAHAVTPNLAR